MISSLYLRMGEINTDFSEPDGPAARAVNGCCKRGSSMMSTAKMHSNYNVAHSDRAHKSWNPRTLEHEVAN